VKADPPFTITPLRYDRYQCSYTAPFPGKMGNTECIVFVKGTHTHIYIAEYIQTFYEVQENIKNVI